MHGIQVMLDEDDSSTTESFDHVVFAGVDEKDKKKFAYLTHYSTLGQVLLFRMATFHIQFGCRC
jgi:hypothetical protein